jgi:hypothetical protein
MADAVETDADLLPEDAYVEAEIEVDEQALAEDAIARLQEQWPGWEPSDADLTTMTIEATASIAAEVADSASTVPSAIFRIFGTKLFNLPYDEGAPAQTTVTFEIIGSAGPRTIPADAEIAIDGFVFTVDDDVDVPDDSPPIAGVAVTCDTDTADANDLIGASVATVTALGFVADITVDAPTAGGRDPQDDEEYQNLLSRKLTLQATTLVTTGDFEELAREQPGIGRAYAFNAGERAVIVYLVDPEGADVDDDVKDALVALYADQRLVNTVVTLADVSRSVINVWYEVKLYPGYDPGDALDRIHDALADKLSPMTYASPEFGDPGTPGLSEWMNDVVIRKTVVEGWILEIEGVHYATVTALSGSTGSATGEDWTMPGDVALPSPGNITGTVI